MDPVHSLTTALAGRYDIVREVGAGGMATVYLAKDLKHDRDVALKVLKPELGAVLGVERFLSEIKTTAKLQHPHILPLLDSGDANGLLFYVMPYVEGESLRARLERERQLPIPDAVRIAREVASALDYAHRHGVIHRDIKPENILLHDGQALVADFGIALAVQSAGGQRMTQTGLSLGTPQYMSPEQAMGEKIVDARSDIYALGAVTYEMLAGDAPFSGSSVQAIVAKVLSERPTPLRTLRDTVPPGLEQAVLTALAKLAADRFTSAKEFADALTAPGSAAPSEAGAAAAPARMSTRAGARGRIAPREIAAWGAVIVIAAAFVWSRLQRGNETASPVIRSVLYMERGVVIDVSLPGSAVAISPKGDLIAYNGRLPGGGSQSQLRRFDALTPRWIVGPAGGKISARNFVFSPNGMFLAFTEGNILIKAPVDGGPATTVTSTLKIAEAYGITWAANDTIYVGSFTGLFAVPAAGGASAPVRARDSTLTANGARWPLALSDGKTLLFVAGLSSSNLMRLGVYDIPSGTTSILDFQVAAPLGVVDDRLVYVAPDGTVMAVAFDRGTRRPVGPSTPLEEGVFVDPTVGAKAMLSPSGTLAYVRGRSEQQVVLARRDAPVPAVLFPETHAYANPRFSPDAKRVAVTVNVAGATDIWIYDISRHTFQRLTTEGVNIRPEWTPDGKKVVFRSERAGKVAIWWQPVDGGGPAELLYEPPVEPFEALISPDAQWLIFRTAPGTQYSRDILAVPLAGERKIVPIATGPATESLPRLSPNGKWIAYQGSGSGKFQIYVRPFPGSGAVTQVTVDGGSEPVWSRSGTELLYRDPNGPIISVSVTTGESFSIGERHPIVSGDYANDASHANYDIAPNGDLLLLKRAGDESQTIIIHNWIRELRAKTAPRK